MREALDLRATYAVSVVSMSRCPREVSDLETTLSCTLRPLSMSVFRGDVALPSGGYYITLHYITCGEPRAVPKTPHMLASYLSES